MRFMRALLLPPLIPLAAVAVVGVGLGYRSVADLGAFVLMWAIFIYPLVVALALGGYLVGRRLGLGRLWHFALGGFLAGSVLCGGWFYGTPLWFVALASVAGGAVGAASAAIVWHQAVRERFAQR